MKGRVFTKELKERGRDDVIVAAMVRNECPKVVSGFMAMVQLRSIDDQVTTSRSVYSNYVPLGPKREDSFPWSLIVWDRRQDVWLATVPQEQVKAMWETTFLVFSDGTTATCPSALPNDTLTIDDKPTTILKM